MFSVICWLSKFFIQILRMGFEGRNYACYLIITNSIKLTLVVRHDAVFQLHPRISTVEVLWIISFFFRYGSIRTLRLVTDTKTGKSKGYAFVEVQEHSVLINLMLFTCTSSLSWQLALHMYTCTIKLQWNLRLGARTMSSHLCSAPSFSAHGSYLRISWEVRGLRHLIALGGWIAETSEQLRYPEGIPCAGTYHMRDYM